MDGKAVLEVDHAAEVLPIGVFLPEGEGFFVAEIVNVLEGVETDHEAGVDGGAAFFTKTGTKMLFQALPVHLSGEFDQGVSFVEDTVQLDLEKSLEGGFGRLFLGFIGWNFTGK